MNTDAKNMRSPALDPVAISPEETARRVSVLRRFRELLQSQRDRFRQYLAVLDKQKDVIEQGDTEALLSHVELEEKILTDIYSIQKVIDPLEDMYRAVNPQGLGGISPGEVNPAGEIPSLKTSLEELKTEAVRRAERNRDLLSQRMTRIRSEIKILRGNPYAGQRSVYTEAAAPSLIDISG
jgi:hypothetical protein